MKKQSIIFLGILLTAVVLLLAGCVSTGQAVSGNQATQGGTGSTSPSNGGSNSPTVGAPAAIADVNEPILLRCSDGTPTGQCSQTKPLFCQLNLALVPNCTRCGCDANKTCDANTQQCIPQDINFSCDDSDVTAQYPDGINPFVAGIVTSGDTNHSDYCSNSTYLIEQYCLQGISATTIDCRQYGMTCIGNACRSDQNQFHLACVGASCQQVSGPGANQCTTNADCNASLGVDLIVNSIPHHFGQDFNAPTFWLDFNVLIQNIGNQTYTGQVTLSGFKQWDANVGGSGFIPFSNTCTVSIPPQSIRSCYFNYSTGNPPTNYHLSAYVDSSHSIPELNENNNDLNATFHLP